MKNPGNSAKLLELPYAPEADALLDELERSGQFRIGIEAEVDDDNEPATSNDYSWGRGSGSVSIQDRATAKPFRLAAPESQSVRHTRARKPMMTNQVHLIQLVNRVRSNPKKPAR